MLTGGRSAARVYMEWAAIEGFNQLTNIRFYFGDERCVPLDHTESNYGLAMRTLFKNGIPSGCMVFPMRADASDQAGAALQYAQSMPSSLDVMLLAVGDDGHIASLFPGSEALHELNQRVISVVGPKPPSNRWTITPPVIASAKTTFVFAPGAIKGAVLHRALLKPEDFDTVPARLVLSGIWLLDTDVQSSGTERVSG